MEHWLPPITADRPPRVYIAGPFRGASLSDIDQNVSRAKALRAPIAKLGCFPVCVHAMEGTSMHDVQQGNGGKFWLDGTLGELETCHAVVLVPGWHTSEGTKGEILRAWALNMPIFEAMHVPDPAAWWAVSHIETFHGVLVHVDTRSDQTFADWVRAAVGSAL